MKSLFFTLLVLIIFFTTNSYGYTYDRNLPPGLPSGYELIEGNIGASSPFIGFGEAVAYEEVSVADALEGLRLNGKTANSSADACQKFAQIHHGSALSTARAEALAEADAVLSSKQDEVRDIAAGDPSYIPLMYPGPFEHSASYSGGVFYSNNVEYCRIGVVYHVNVYMWWMVIKKLPPPPPVAHSCDVELFRRRKNDSSNSSGSLTAWNAGSNKYLTSIGYKGYINAEPSDPTKRTCIFGEIIGNTTNKLCIANRNNIFTFLITKDPSGGLPIYQQSVVTIPESTKRVDSSPSFNMTIYLTEEGTVDSNGVRGDYKILHTISAGGIPGPSRVSSGCE